MRDEPTDRANVAVSLPSDSAGPVESRGDSASRDRRRRRADWRIGGRAVARWNNKVIAALAIGGGVGVLAATALLRAGLPWAAPLSTLALWIGMTGAVTYALLRARPAALFKFRAVDLLWGFGLGTLLRFLFGSLSGLNINVFPTLSSTNTLAGGLELLGGGFIGPVVEELFFRAVLLVAIYQFYRRSLGGISSAATASLMSAGLFVCLHAGFDQVTLESGLQLFILGLTGALLVFLTGRIWGSVLMHLCYNWIFLSVSFAGAALS